MGGDSVVDAAVAAAREREISRYGVLEEPAGNDLQALVELAAQVFGVSSAAINLISGSHQHQLATTGVDPSICSREDSMCAAVVTEPDPVVVGDSRTDPLFATNPFVTGQLGLVRFYASAPLVTPDGVPIGRLCVFDEEVRSSTPRQAEALRVLAARVMDVLELRLRTRQLERSLDELVRTQEELHRSNEALGHFASQVSHDLRNPLMVISANAEMLSTEPQIESTPELASMVADIGDASHRMTLLMTRILHQARTGGRPARATVDLGEVFREVLDDVRPIVDTSHATVSLGDLPCVSADRELVYAVALNLVTNALKFTRPGTAPEIHVGAERRPRGWRVSVADRGVGLGPDTADAVFRPFVRGEGTGGAPGHGIGLATVRRAVDALGGRAGLSPRPGGGTTAWFDLPDPELVDGSGARPRTDDGEVPAGG